ncbi:MAG: M23 family metallopeptidase [Bacteroidales bacterium]|jgi:hypothetical protein|nr:M23 family metallopeptidase [Bacteroidales bacterium]
MILALLIFVNILFPGNPGDEPKDRTAFSPPLRIPLLLSANFGELRVDHFHSGIDIKTQGVTGKEVVAAAPGYVYRISVSPGGFGKALYLMHPSGYSTVYGHLDRFTPEIESYVKSRQYVEKSFMITLWPSKDRFHFNKGDIIAYSGNSGSSSGPHLHFEIRRSDEEIPVNPLLFEFGVNDDFRPVIEKLGIYPVGRGSYINGKNKPLKLNVSGGNGNYHISSDNVISISGEAGFGIKSYDILNSTNNKCSVFSIELKIDSSIVYNYKMDSFSFNESGYINSHIDYESYVREKAFYERTYILPGDRLSVYGDIIKRGIYSFTDKKKHQVEITVSDIHGNRSKLKFYVRSVSPPENIQVSDEPDDVIMMPYGRNNRFISGNVSVTIPSGALYDTLWFRFGKTDAQPGMYSELYHIHNKYTPLHKAFHLSIKPDDTPAGQATKLLIIRLTDDRKKIPLATSWDNGRLTANSGSFGNFYVGIDTIPPSIVPVGFTPGSDLGGREILMMRIRDDLSGIKAYQPQIDGKWALFEYDQKNELLIYRFDPERIRKGTKHMLILSVTDNRDNVRTYECEFEW